MLKKTSNYHEISGKTLSVRNNQNKMR